METNHTIDVLSLDKAHRRALEDLIGAPLLANQRLVIGVSEIDASQPVEPRGESQSLKDWSQVYAGLSDDQIDQIDLIINTRADLTRNLP